MPQWSENMAFSNKSSWQRHASSWRHPVSSLRKSDGHRTTSPGLTLNVSKPEETENYFISSDCCQDPAQTVDTQDTEESIALFCQDKVGWSPQIPTPQESLSGLLGLAVEGWHCLGTSVPSTHGETWDSYLGSQKAASLLLTQVRLCFSALMNRVLTDLPV